MHFEILLYAYVTVFVIRCIWVFVRSGGSAVLTQINLTLIAVVCLLVLTIVAAVLPITILVSPAVAWKSLVGIDQCANASLPHFLNWLFGVEKGCPAFGDEDETVSSVLGKLHTLEAGNWFAKLIYKMLDSLQKNHCELSIESDEGETK